MVDIKWLHEEPEDLFKRLLDAKKVAQKKSHEKRRIARAARRTAGETSELVEDKLHRTGKMRNKTTMVTDSLL